ncbi:hypothetical protein D1872_306710 [compost metagenome]
MILELTFTSSEQTRNVRHLIVIYPHPAHGVVNRREDAHGQLAWIVTDEFLIDFNNSAELDVQLFGILMR